jgi:hypothetical protein
MVVGGQGVCLPVSEDAQEGLGNAPKFKGLSWPGQKCCRDLDRQVLMAGGIGRHVELLYGVDPEVKLLVRQQGTGAGHDRTLQQVPETRAEWYRAWQSIERCAGRDRTWQKGAGAGMGHSRTWQRGATSGAGSDGPGRPVSAALCDGELITVPFCFKKKEKQLGSTLEMLRQFVEESPFEKKEPLSLHPSESSLSSTDPCSQAWMVPRPHN